jgi:hypothetical protein
MKADEPRRGIAPGTPVVLVLHTPREKCWGVLDEISPAGVFLRGLDLNAFDDWVHAVAHNEPFFGLNDLFFPLWRLERIARDEASAGVFSLFEQVEQRTGRSVTEIFSDSGGNVIS